MAACLCLAACIPQSKEKAPRPRPSQPSNSAVVRQCMAKLSSQSVRFKPLDDRYFGSGCSAVGTVQLLDIGTPVTNLGPMTCTLADAFTGWIREAVQPAARAWLGTTVVKVETFGTYSCRPVNGQSGAKLSEHGLSNAVDVSAFVLGDGRRVTVLDGWSGGSEDVQRFLRAVHHSGCRHFNIGLGPDANAYHRNHFHFDMGRGPYCR